MPKVKIKNNREKIANLLLSIGCVNINFKKKFTLTSGKKSPVYVDCRKLISFPKEREIIINEICLLYTSPSPRDRQKSRMPSSA